MVQLQTAFAKISDDEKFQYLFSSSYRDAYNPTTSTWSKRESVSVHNEVIIGYFSYHIDRDSDIAYGLQIVNFTGSPNIIFSKDLKRFISNIFKKYRHRKLTFSCFTDNPIIDSYKRLCTKYGGKIVGVREKQDRLLDGDYHDVMLFEILRDNFLR